MAETFKIRILNLCFEFLANTLVFRLSLQPAGTIPAGAFQAFLHTGHQFLILIQTNFRHVLILLTIQTPRN